MLHHKCLLQITFPIKDQRNNTTMRKMHKLTFSAKDKGTILPVRIKPSIYEPYCSTSLSKEEEEGTKIEDSSKFMLKHYEILWFLFKKSLHI